MFQPKYYSSFCVLIHDDITSHFTEEEVKYEFDKISDDYYEYSLYPHFPLPDYYYKKIEYILEDELSKHNKKLYDYLVNNEITVTIEVFKRYDEDLEPSQEYTFSVYRT